MIRQYEVEDIIENALCDLNGKLSKPNFDTNECIVFEADTDKTQSGEILFSFKEDIMSDDAPDKFRIRVEDVTFDIEKEDVKKYQMGHPVYYQMTPSINTKCPVGYDWFKCSSKEQGMCCRTCANYNPLRMLYEKELKPGIKLGVPLQILWADAEIQLEHEEKIEGFEQRMNQEINEKYLKQMKNCKTEVDHEDADYILCELLEKLGYKELVDAYREVPKWYS